MDEQALELVKENLDLLEEGIKETVFVTNRRKADGLLSLIENIRLLVIPELDSTDTSK